MRHISGTIKHNIMIFGTLMLDDDISRRFLFIILKFSFFGLLAGLRGKKLRKLKNNNYIQHAPYLRNSITYDHGLFFIVLKFSFFGLLDG